jgi:arylsulfatase A-like enzyme
MAVSHLSCRVKRVLFLGIDGCRWDCINSTLTPALWGLIETNQKDSYNNEHPLSSSSPHTFSPSSTISPYQRHAAFSFQSQVNDICLSGPGWTSAATGVWRRKHGVNSNEVKIERRRKWKDVFQRLKHFHPSIQTASIVNWPPLNNDIHTNVDHVFTHENDDAKVVSSSISLLSTVEDLSYVFVHLDAVDTAGHTYDYGPTIPAYVEAVQHTDANIGRILTALSQRKWRDSESWLIIASTDHGGENFNHELNTPNNRRTWIILNGEDVIAGEIYPQPMIVDIAPTILVHLGCKINPNWDLDGRILPIRYDGTSWIDEKNYNETTKKERNKSGTRE